MTRSKELEGTGPPDELGAPGLLGLSESFSQEERETSRRVHALAERFSPHIEGWWHGDGMPREAMVELGDAGLLGMHIEGHGCAGTTATAYGLACLELEAADSGLRTAVSVQGSLAMYGLLRYGSEEQRAAWLPEMAAGRAIGAFALTEPGAGSDPAGMETSARRVGTDWVVSGEKAWITHGAQADLVIVWARTDDGVRGFAVPGETPGLTRVDVEGKYSLRAVKTSHLKLEEVRLPLAAMLPEARGLGAPLSCLNEARFGIAWGAIGAARSCLGSALQHAGARHQFGRPLASFQLVQSKLTEMAMAVEEGLLLAIHLGRLKDGEGVAPHQISFGKLANVDRARDVARTAREVLGATGIADRYPVMRHMANLESVVTYEGTAEMHRLILGNELTGVAAFR